MQYTRDSKGTVEVDGDIYEWEIRRQPQPKSGGKWEGMAVTLCLVDFKREAIIQFPPPLRPQRSAGRREAAGQRRCGSQRRCLGDGGGLEPDLARQAHGL